MSNIAQSQQAKCGNRTSSMELWAASKLNWPLLVSAFSRSIPRRRRLASRQFKFALNTLGESPLVNVPDNEAKGSTTESLMHSVQSDRPGDRRLRFVFGDSVASMRLPDDATFGDIAQSLRYLQNSRSERLVVIDVQFGRLDAEPHFSSLARHWSAHVRK